MNHDHPCYKAEFVNAIVQLYLEGMAIEDICMFTGCDSTEIINAVLDRTVPYL